MDEERRQYGDEDQEVMTRAEWIEYARAECEKQLPVMKEPEMQEGGIEEEETLHAVYVPISEEEAPYEEEMAGQLPGDEEEDYENPILHAMQYDNVIPINEIEKIKWSYMTKLGVRVIAAVVIGVFAISLDHFGFKTEYISGEKIKNAITKNDSIEQIEESVSSFAKDKIIPLISGGDKQEKTTNESDKNTNSNQ